MARWLKKCDPSPIVAQIECSRRVTDAGKVQFTGSNLVDIMIVPTRLAAMVELSPSVPIYEKYSIVKRAIWSTAKKGKIDKRTVLREIKRLEAEYIGKPEKSYVIVTSLSIHHDMRLPNILFDECKITFSKKIPKKFTKWRQKSECDFELRMGRIEYPKRYMFSTICISGRTYESVVRKGLSELNLFRGLLNLGNNIRFSHTFHFGSPQMPINHILLGPLHTLHDKTGKIAEGPFWYEPDYRKPQLFPFRAPDPLTFKKIVNFAQNMGKRIRLCVYKSEIEAAILRYNDALDIYDWNTAYIKLWSVLEYLTNTLNGRYDITIRRAAFLHKDYDGTRQILELLRRFRNNLVHCGISDQTIEVFIYDLKMFVEQLLLFFISNKYNFKSLEETAEFLD